MISFKENRNCYLTESQRDVLLNLVSYKDIREKFFLTGGTALSVFYLHHRKSNDLDLFTVKEADISEIDFFLRTELSGEYKKIRESSNFLSILIGDTKVDFVVDILSNKEEREKYIFENKNTLMIDNIKNISSNKLCTIASRSEPKDFIDFYYLNNNVPEFDIEQIYSDASLKDAIFDDPPTAAYQIESNFNFIKNNQEIFPELLVNFEKESFFSYYENFVKKLYNRIVP